MDIQMIMQKECILGGKKFETGTVYKHYKNKTNYIIISFCKIQENNNWIEAVIYTEVGGTELFVRSLKEFENKFK